MKAGSSVPQYESVAGVLVSGTDITANPLYVKYDPNRGVPTVAVPQADGTYALFELHYQGGPVQISATIGDETARAIAFKSAP